MATDVQAADMVETSRAFAEAYAAADEQGIAARLDEDVRCREITPSLDDRPPAGARRRARSR